MGLTMQLRGGDWLHCLKSANRTVPSIRQPAVTHAAHPLALASCTLHITHAAYHARTSRTLHIALHATTSTLAQHAHTHMPQPVRRQGGALAKFW
jgi:hypothetical protein